MSDRATFDHDIAMTARWTAGGRAYESLREDRLFSDPWAGLLAGSVGREWIEQDVLNTRATAAIRTRYWDDFLIRATTQQPIRQVVLLAAGLDTRAFRIPWPEQTQFFEVDQAQVLAYKDQLLTSVGAQATCQRHTLVADLTANWAEPLIAAGFDPQQRSAWVMEGLLCYLPDEAVSRLIDEITHISAAGSWMGFDALDSLTLTSPLSRPRVELHARNGVPWISTMDDPASFLAPRGWDATQTTAMEVAQKYGRQLYRPDDPQVPEAERSKYWFVTAQKRM